MSSDFERFLLDTSPETIRYNCCWWILKTNKQKPNQSKTKRTTRRTNPKQIPAEYHDYYGFIFFTSLSIFHSKTVRMPSEKQCIWQHQKRTVPLPSYVAAMRSTLIHQTTTSNARPHKYSHSLLACLHFLLFLPAPSCNITWLLRNKIKPSSEKSVFFSVTY